MPVLGQPLHLSVLVYELAPPGDICFRNSEPSSGTRWQTVTRVPLCYHVHCGAAYSGDLLDFSSHRQPRRLVRTIILPPARGASSFGLMETTANKPECNNIGRAPRSQIGGPGATAFHRPESAPPRPRKAPPVLSLLTSPLDRECAEPDLGHDLQHPRAPVQRDA